MFILILTGSVTVCSAICSKDHKSIDLQDPGSSLKHSPNSLLFLSHVFVNHLADVELWLAFPSI